MPNRILKESICTSPTVDELDWFEEVVFYRLIVQCDDFGRMDARLPILHSRLFPLKAEVTGEQLETALDTLEAAGLIDRYTVAGLPYLRLMTWEKHQNIRRQRYRYPPPIAFLTDDVVENQ